MVSHHAYFLICSPHFPPYPLVIKHSYGSWIYGWFSWGSTMKNNDFDHVGGSWNRGTPKSSKSLEHFSIETSGDLGIPHDFGNLHIYIYIYIYVTYFPIVFLNFPPHVFPIFPISYHHITWMARSPGAAQGDPRAHQGRVFRRLQRVALQQSGGPGDGDGDLLWLFLRETMMCYIYIYIYVCVYLCISLFTYLFIYLYICVYVYIDLIYIYIYTYIYLSLFVVFYLHTHIYIYIGRKRCRHGCRDVDWNDFLLRICNMYICSTLLCVCVYIYIGERLEVPRNIEEPCDTIIHVWSSNIQKGGGVLASFELR